MRARDDAGALGRFFLIFWPIWTAAMLALGILSIVSGSSLWPVTWIVSIPLSVTMTVFSWREWGRR